MPSSEVSVEQFIQVVGNLRCIARKCIKSFEGQRGIQANPHYIALVFTMSLTSILVNAVS